MTTHSESVRERDDLIGQRVEWQGQSWFVAVAQDDETHWHLTLTAPGPSRLPTPHRRTYACPRHHCYTHGCRQCVERFVGRVRALLEEPRTVLAGNNDGDVQ